MTLSTPVENRTKLSRERCRSSAAFASCRPPLFKANAGDGANTEGGEDEVYSGLFAVVCHKGLEVIFTVKKRGEGEELVAVHSRSRVIFQRIPLNDGNTGGSDEGKSVGVGSPTTNLKGKSPKSPGRKNPETPKATVVALTSTNNGRIYLLFSSGVLKSYIPQRSDPKVIPFGKFRWVQSDCVNVCEAFGLHSSGGSSSVGQVFTKDEVPLLSASSTKVLLTHHDTAALYDFPKLAWRHHLGAKIEHASLSGDGCALALALKGEGVGVPFPFGVRTFVLEDGSGGNNSSGNNSNSAEQVDAATEAAKAAITQTRHVRKRSGFEVGPVENPPVPKKGEFDGLLASVFGDASNDNNTSSNNNGNNNNNNNNSNSSNKNALTYTPGPFLVHTSTPTRLSFRKHGTLTSSAPHNHNDYYTPSQGNDLLLTTSTDGSVRIFSQNSWRQLMQWNSPPQSRADWVKGISAANLGDLDVGKKKKEKDKLSPIPKDVDHYSQHNDQVHSDALHPTPNPNAIPSHSEPGTHAGAWIAELTFRNTFPALRLSRLSYMRSGGDDALPAHFESVAAILPPGCLEENRVLDTCSQGNGLEVEGVWPLWDAWDESKLGGATSGDGAPRWLGDGAELGGSHVPPSELRITSCFARGVNQIEMPLWGDKDFGAMEFGSPIRHVLDMGLEGEKREDVQDLACAELEFEAGSRLCARSSVDGRSIDLWWRKHGAVHLEEDLGMHTSGPKIFRDVSLTPLPLCLPSLILPGKPFKPTQTEKKDFYYPILPEKKDALASTICFDKHSVSSLHWWPDENFGGPPRLVTLTQGGTLIVFEMPPPWSALEPPMPSYDPFDDAASRGSSVASDYGMNHESFESPVNPESSFDGGENQQQQYEVEITPHPDFGIGLRLEAQAPGMPAIAGSFKKHPLSGGRLPAERAGMISVGDELLAVNEISLEGMPFEKAIATVRQIGFDSFGAPLRMVFRRCKGRRSRGSAPSLSTGSRSSRPHKAVKSGDESAATLEVGADAENQQEFGRIIAIVRDVVVVGALDPSQPPAMLLIPWNFGKGAVVSHKMYGGALILWAIPGKRIIKAARLEVVLDIDPENTRFIEIGSIQLQAAQKKRGESQSTIKSISFVSSTENGWLVAILDSTGNASLLFVDTCTKNATPKNAASSNSPSDIKATFRYYPSVFNVHKAGPDTTKSDPKESCIFRSFSLELFGCMGCRRGCKEITIWSAMPETKHRVDKSLVESPYKCSLIMIDDVKELSDQVILDFRWIQSGFMDAFPWLVLFTQHAAVLYRRPCHELNWQPIAILFYKSGASMETISPHIALPHLISAFQCAVHANDEEKSLRTDWHPESILANICTEGGGVHLALQSHTYGLYSWLSQWMNPDETMRPSWDASGSVATAPFRVVSDKTVIKPAEEKKEGNDSVETSANLMAAMTLNTDNTKPLSKEESALIDLQRSLCPFDESQPENEQSKEFTSAMASTRAKKSVEVVDKKPLPPPLLGLNKDEQTCVWVIGDIICNMPSFQKLDSLSQLCLFAVTLMRRLVSAKERSINADESKPEMLTYIDGRPVFEKQPSTVGSEQIEEKYIASSGGFLSALMSDTQSRLIEACRPKDEKFNWVTARAVGIPFWVRSEKSLVSIADEIAQTVYKSTKNVMDCALYYIAMRNMKKLRAMAATDRSDSGKKFFTFITDHNFSSDRGRNAAEKNAYSLLRKRKYVHAASFFLLSEPPMIKTALNIIKSQLNDVSLAFFVARLMEHALKKPTGPSDSLTIGGGFNLSSMGGGGGFAGSGSVADTSMDAKEESEPFSEWEPCLGIHARSVLKPDLEEQSDGDNCFDCLQLLWLDRPNDAMLRLAHMPADRSGNVSSNDCVAPVISHYESESTPSDVVTKTNAVINFCSGPSLLKVLQPKKRILWSSALLVSSALNRSGIELPSMRIVREIANSAYDDKANNKKQKKTKKGLLSETNNGVHQSTENKAPSIFDSFAPAPFKPKAKPKPAADPMPSSIFDSFDAPPPKPKAKPQPAADTMSSSIFDSFDAPPPKPKAKPQPAADPMSSSIFDSFDAAPSSKPKAKPQPATGTMSTSIFDSFDAPASKKAANTNVAAAPNHQAIEEEEKLEIPEFSPLWNEWQDRLVRVFSAGRLLREMARITSSFHCEPHYASIESITNHNHSTISAGSYEVLHKPCDSVGLLAIINNTLSELKSSFGINEEVILEQALELMYAGSQSPRLACRVLLQCLLGRSDRAEDTVRDAALCLMNQCESLGLSNDVVVNNKDAKCFTSSQWTRRNNGNTIFQLEICMWLHRGGTFEISSAAAKETLLAVRVGLATINWGRCYQTLNTLIKAEPDCLVDYELGRNLWVSMKIISVNDNAMDCVEGVTSGGWEFLVDCRREEATEMLRDGMPGQFLIRPHHQDPGVFTISFKTNLVPTDMPPTTNYDDAGVAKTEQKSKDAPSPSKIIKRDDVVQHAIIRLTDTGFRCGSFGPFATLTKLLQAVSGSLPFALRFNDPPVKGIIKERGVQSSPNSFLFKKLALQSTAEFIHVGSKNMEINELDGCSPSGILSTPTPAHDDKKEEPVTNDVDDDIKVKFGQFAQLLFLTDFRKQLCSVAAARIDEPAIIPTKPPQSDHMDEEYDGSISEGSLEADEEENLSNASRMVRPLLQWCRAKEIEIVDEIAPPICEIPQPALSASSLSVTINGSGDEFEIPSAASPVEGHTSTRGDAMIRNCIQPGSGVDFRTLRVGEPGNSVIVVLFGKQEAAKWLAANETGGDENEALERLKTMELMRVIEPITSVDLSLPKGYAATHPSAASRYRFVDPWEVEPLESKAGETASAALGRGRYQTLTVGLIASACEHVIRLTGGLHLLGLWSSLRGGLYLTKALCSAHPSWERDAGGDLLMKGGFLLEPSSYENSIRQHLYGNSLFRSLNLPQRFIALVQVDLLDLKNVTTPSGSSSLTAYAMLRLKRKGSSAPLNHKARSLDSAMTQARKISKISGPNAPASWGSIVRFRFPLPDDVDCEGKSFDPDRESLFKGPPTCLQVTVFEKKFMSDVELGGADVNLDSLGTGGQIEEWVPLRVGKDGITWFARMRISLRFELMCLDSSSPAEEGGDDRCPSIALQKIRSLSRLGAHEDHNMKSSISTPQLMGGYFGNMGNMLY